MIIVLFLGNTTYRGVVFTRSEDSQVHITRSNELREALLERDLKMGYATYWNAYNNSVFFDFEPEIVALYGDLATPKLHLTSTRFFQPDYFTGRTFLFLLQNEYNHFQQDTRLQMRYGTPDEIFEMHGFFIVAYDYNISSNFTWASFMPNLERSLLYLMHENELTEYGENSFILHKDGLIFGPYISLEAGRYRLIVDCLFQDDETGLYVNITANVGETFISSVFLESGRNIFEFEIYENKENVEFVIHNTEFEEVIVSKLSLTLLD
jgi:hypothetical protein